MSEKESPRAITWRNQMYRDLRKIHQGKAATVFAGREHMEDAFRAIDEALVWNPIGELIIVNPNHPDTKSSEKSGA